MYKILCTYLTLPLLTRTFIWVYRFLPKPKRLASGLYLCLLALDSLRWLYRFRLDLRFHFLDRLSRNQAGFLEIQLLEQGAIPSNICLSLQFTVETSVIV